MEDKFKIGQCVKCANSKIVDTNRIIDKLDKLFDKKDFVAAENLIKYWISESQKSNNMELELTFQNEYMGFLRKIGSEKKAFLSTDRAYKLLKILSLDNTIFYATTCLNIGTVYKSFGKSHEAINFFIEAKVIYEKKLSANNKLLAGLYNNMALAYVDICEFEEAKLLYKNAIKIMHSIKNGKLDEAISYLNYADLIYKQYNYNKYGEVDYLNKIDECIKIAWELLIDKQNINDEYYRFVCEKSAKTFGFYGYFVYEKEINKRSKHYA